MKTIYVSNIKKLNKVKRGLKLLTKEFKKLKKTVYLSTQKPRELRELFKPLRQRGAQAELSRITGIDRGYINRLYQGKTTCPRPSTWKILRAGIKEMNRNTY